MEYLFLNAKAKSKVSLSRVIAGRLPKRIGLATTIQYIDQLPNIQKQLVSLGKKVFLVEGRHTLNKGQILGCDTDTVYSVNSRVDAFLYIGDGLFHPKMIALSTEKPVFIFNPKDKKLSQISRKDVDAIIKRKKGALLRFYASRNIGIIATTKYGQSNLEGALAAKRKLEKQGKNVYVFLCDTLNLEELDNFPFIECWVNTMCPRIGLDDTERTGKRLVNLADLNLHVKNIYTP